MPYFYLLTSDHPASFHHGKCYLQILRRGYVLISTGLIAFNLANLSIPTPTPITTNTHVKIIIKLLPVFRKPNS